MGLGGNLRGLKPHDFNPLYAAREGPLFHDCANFVELQNNRGT